MEESIEELLNHTYTETEVRAMHPVTLAYIGDGVFSEYIRRYLLAKGMRHVNHLTKESIHYVKAGAQAKMVQGMLETLTETEKAIVKRGRNTKSHVPKNAVVMDYRYATGFEALLGYLCLTKQKERLEAVIVQGIQIIEANTL